ncbi:aromatic ring-hydroxylating dioxygenase subunit alpha [Mollicutes bacterium LVI A0039]|nr:aromatic ring-hydroxylating dioxygenase subunit alpha [Mollicutes bacterium LVI A0039]
MISNQWYVVLDSKQLKSDKLLGIKRLNKQLVFYRESTGQVVCMEDKCSHRGVQLSIGSLNHNCVTCPFHGFEFNSDGECIKIPANGKDSPVSKRFNVRTYPTHEADGFIYIYNGENPDELPKFFTNLSDVSYSTTYNNWNTHYSRSIENQLDVVHVPFVHSKTIGRGNKTLVNGPVTEIDEKNMTIYVFNQVDEGQTPLKASEMTDYDNYFKLKFIFPNLWQNKITDKLSIVAAFAPVDEENTVIYLRTYQSFTNIPLIKQLAFVALNAYNLKVLNEDKRVVITQEPRNTHLDIKENLIPGDVPIGMYRKMVKTASQDRSDKN